MRCPAAGTPASLAELGTPTWIVASPKGGSHDQDRGNCARGIDRRRRRGSGADVLFRRRSGSVLRPAALLWPRSIRPLPVLRPLSIRPFPVLRSLPILRPPARLLRRTRILPGGPVLSARPLPHVGRVSAGLDGSGRPVQTVPRLLTAQKRVKRPGPDG